MFELKLRDRLTFFEASDAQSVVPGPAASSGNFLKMQIFGPHPKTAESETLEMASRSLF